jgi:hypothetical protein
MAFKPCGAPGETWSLTFARSPLYLVAEKKYRTARFP